MQKIGIRLIQMSAIYMVIGLVLGMVMAISHNYQARTVHTHLNLLGWMAMGLTGVIYTSHPSVAKGLLSKIHFWTHSVGMPVMMVGLAFHTFGKTEWEPALGVGSVLTTGGLLCFALNVVKRL